MKHNNAFKTTSTMFQFMGSKIQAIKMLFICWPAIVKPRFLLDKEQPHWKNKAISLDHHDEFHVSVLSIILVWQVITALTQSWQELSVPRGKAAKRELCNIDLRAVSFFRYINPALIAEKYYCFSWNQIVGVQ